MSFYELVDEEPYVAGRHVAWACCIMLDDTRLDHDPACHSEHSPASRSHFWRNRGFHVPLENGLMLSTQWGNGNYCRNRDMPPWYTEPFNEQCPDAEIACWWDNGRIQYMLPWEGMDDSVVGWVLAEHWWTVLDRLAALPTGTDPIPALVLAR